MYILLYVLLLAAIGYSLWAQFNVKSTFKKYAVEPTASGMTGYDAARMILDRNGLQHVAIERVAGDLTDHYDPKTNVIRLSESVYGAGTTAAVGVAAHEAGHAVQYAVGYTPVKVRTAILPACSVGSKIALPLILVGMLISIYFSSSGSNLGYILAMAGVLAYGLAALFQFVTLPVEFNASSRALAALSESGAMSADELNGSKKVLKAAARTYVAAFAVSLLQFLRLLLMVSGRRRR